MMYSFKREVFPVDTHVLRIVKRVGFRTGDGSIRSARFANIIQEQVPRRYRCRLHVNLVQHGRKICKGKPNCRICPIGNLCLLGKKKHRNQGTSNKHSRKKENVLSPNLNFS